MKILKKQKELVVDKLEKTIRDLFLEMFKKNLQNFQVHIVWKYKRLDWSTTKIKKNFKNIRETGDFVLDQRKVKSTVSKINSEISSF